MDYEYFRVEESEQFSFFRIPKALFTEKEFEGLSTDAKLLYGILLDRINLSKKNGWVDELGAERVLFGTDAPFCDPMVEIKKVLLAGLTEEQLEYVMYKNAVRLMGLEE